MSFRDKLQNFIFFRSLFTVTGQRSPYAAKTKDFPAYFQYKIGDFEKDYYLYFRKQPYLQLYKNEIFNKMYEYTGYDLIWYLEFHYEAFEDKADFIRFLQLATASAGHWRLRMRSRMRCRCIPAIQIRLTIHCLYP